MNSKKVDQYIKALRGMNFSFKDANGMPSNLGTCESESEILNVVSEFANISGPNVDPILEHFIGDMDYAISIVIPQSETGHIDLLMIYYMSEKLHPNHGDHGYVAKLVRSFINRNLYPLFEFMSEDCIRLNERIIMEQLQIVRNTTGKSDPFWVSSEPGVFKFIP